MTKISKYGSPPKIIDNFYSKYLTEEMMAYLYLPIIMPGNNEILMPSNLKGLHDLICACLNDFVGHRSREELNESYVYATVKNLYVSPGNPGNREGWHADGYGSDGDINYIYHSINPTEFAIQKFDEISKEDSQSMVDMDNQIDYSKIITYTNNTLLRLDEGIIHRVGPVIETGMRLFIKISISKHKFNLKGNSHNYQFDYDWDLHDRQATRNLDNNNKDYA